MTNNLSYNLEGNIFDLYTLEYDKYYKPSSPMTQGFAQVKVGTLSSFHAYIVHIYISRFALMFDIGNDFVVKAITLSKQAE